MNEFLDVTPLHFGKISREYLTLIKDFDCGKEVVNNFLKIEALKLHELRKVITHLAFDENQNLVGYFSLFNESVTIVKSKREQQNWDDIRSEKSIFPAIRLHFLGVNKDYQGRGYGEQLLFEAIAIVKSISTDSGCNFITLETQSDTIQFYIDRMFVRLKQSDHDHSYNDMCLRFDWYY
ncbi:GNAT family N-acetyltransferase [Paenibacillus thalictri]|uniref:GNAT family N-acetyltransferase n=1 Tax=Paenibacillus thalictri TaxID=2527873 RepID=A0A4Q9DXQ6_9BACL|nr:GNAT family N-acetyltransferase [Paenibacillus thalictri]TBL80643.1 GNAT family N-acetyltransferase [Paenibacillus thalictri]